MYNPYYRHDERFIPFLGPFLLGGIGGAALVGASRPRPMVYQPYPMYRPYPYYGGYGYY